MVKVKWPLTKVVMELVYVSDLEHEIRKTVLENAVKYDGIPSAKSVMNALLGSRVELRKRAKEVKEIVTRLVDEIGAMPLEEQRAELQRIAPELLERPEVVVKKSGELPDLPNVDQWDKVVMRLAPFPSGPLHVGNARMVILNDYYVKRYDGKLILVFDDTIGSAEKQVEPEAYDLIPEGLDYLGVKYHEIVYKSDRLDIFYDYAVDLIKQQEAYVCDCDPNIWRTEHKAKGIPCACRSLSVEENLARWEKMLDGTYPERAAAVRLKTGMDNPDPAMRDHVILRISETDHPRVGTKYRVWPLLEFSWGIDDHDLGITHIIRGKDLVKEGKIEQHIWDIYGWQHPELLYYGRLRFQDVKLSKSKSRVEVHSGVYSGWDDPRTWSLQSLQKRGIHPDAIRKVMLDLGLSIVDVSFSMKAVYSENRRLRDADAPRYFFVHDPVWLDVKGLPSSIHEATPHVHPDFPDIGVRHIPIVRDNGDVVLGIQETDFNKIGDGGLFRMKDLANFTLHQKDRLAEFHSRDVGEIRAAGGSIIQWVPKEGTVPVELLMVDGTVIDGLAEPSMQNVSEGVFLQFVRYGFARIYETGDTIKAAFAHK
ncbi:MAG: glutamate--tRNA ligase [Candidatus Thorarchaeota archaeon]|nr:glutamate--tRNA ligase [Candidatus Thorarchaeota archaeon]